MEFKIYTAGKMSGTSLDKQMSWRYELEHKLKNYADGKQIKFIHPPLFYNYETDNHRTEREIKEWELNHLADCDIVVVNLEGIESSIGTHMELGFVDAINSNCAKHIYVVGIGDESALHPWLKLSLFRCAEDINDACQFILEYLLE